MAEVSPLVSIITPAYNRASYLDETIQSVLSQDYQRIEYIVLDDGSTDNTRAILTKYSGRLIFETHPNMGEARTVNKGWSMTHGEFVAVVNSDDPLLPGAISSGVAFMQSHPDILVAYPDWNYIGPESKVISHIRVHEYDYLFMLRRHYCMVGPGALIRRTAIELAGLRDPEFRYVADFEFWLRLGLYGRFARIPQTLATFRMHPDSASEAYKGLAMANEHIRLIEKFYSRPELPQEVVKVRAEAFAWAHLEAASACGRARWEARKHYLKAIQHHPSLLWEQQDKLGMPLSLMLPQPLFKLVLRAWCRVYPVLAKWRSLVRQSISKLAFRAC